MDYNSCYMDFRLAFSSFKIAPICRCILRSRDDYLEKHNYQMQYRYFIFYFYCKIFFISIVGFCYVRRNMQKCIKRSVTCLPYYRNVSVFLIDTFDIRFKILSTNLIAVKMKPAENVFWAVFQNHNKTFY